MDLPDGLEAFAREFSRYKTPTRRTQGWREQAHERRGEGDVLDTIGTLMLWRHLVSNGRHATYQLTAGGGDETDLLVRIGEKWLDVNVKTSKWQPKENDDPCQRSHIAVKEEEFGKGFAALYIQVIVHLVMHGTADRSHVHFCRWIESASDEFGRQEVTTIPNAGSQRGYWIGPRHTQPFGDIVAYLGGTASSQ